MAAALGTYWQKLDDKNRIVLPAQERVGLAGGTHLARGQSRCVYLFSDEQLEQYKTETSQSTPPGIPAIAFDRIFFSSIASQNLDSQGRITIPADLREYAGLERDLAVIVLDKRLEIWDAEAWIAYLDQYLPAFSAATEGLR